MTNERQDEMTERLCDMRDGYKLRVMQSSVDGDIHVSILPERSIWVPENVEFCASGSSSPKTFLALRRLMEAMAEDEKDRPQAEQLRR